MPTVVGRSQSISLDGMKVKQKIASTIPVFKENNEFSNLFTNCDTSLGTKKDKEKAKDIIRDKMIKQFGVKVKDTLLDELLEVAKHNALMLELLPVSLADISEILEALPDKAGPKIRWAIEEQNLIGLRITLGTDQAIALFIIQVDEETVWAPISFKCETTGTLSEDDCRKLDSFILTTLFDAYPHNYACTITGPKGGVLEIGRVFCVKEKVGEKIEHELSGKCILSY